MTTLTELANKYNSDKGDQVGCCHRYATLYEKVLAPYREKPITFLEIGLQRIVCQHEHDCPSLRMWLDYFPHATIHGLDIQDFSDVDIPRAKIHQGDQGDPESLRRVAEDDGPFDVIIDDGSHASKHQQITLGTLFPYLKPGGIYIIEDAHWQPERNVEIRDGIETMQEIFTRFSIQGKPFQSPFLSPQECRYIEENVFRCTFSHPFVDDRARTSTPSAIRSIARRLLKGKRPSRDRRFKLIVLQKLDGDDVPQCEGVTAQITCDAV